MDSVVLFACGYLAALGELCSEGYMQYVCISKGIASASEECLYVSKPDFLTHISEEGCQLMAY